MNLSRELETPRLRLRPFALRDAEPMYALLRDPVVNTFLPWFPAQTLAEAEEMLRSRYIGGPGVHYAVCLRGEDAPIGYVSLAEGRPTTWGTALPARTGGRASRPRRPPPSLRRPGARAWPLSPPRTTCTTPQAAASCARSA